MAPARLALVPGEPAGVGPELCVRALQRDWDARITVIGDLATLRAAAARLALPLPCVDIDDPGAPVRYRDIANAVAVTPGVPSRDNARAVIDALTAGATGCQQGDYDGLVTGPVHKATINLGGIAYTGTTELLADLAGVPVLMMLANDVVRVALVTTHLPLRAVPDAVTVPLVERCLRILHAALVRDEGIASPVIAVLGLNPHAGEDGHLGREEVELLSPLLDRLRADGLRLEGPLPADTAFLPRRLAAVDAVLAMYHDQGLPVLKYSGFEHAVNVTLGLPYPRVAVDHGTALDLAGTGRADPSSLHAALATCRRMAGQRR